MSIYIKAGSALTHLRSMLQVHTTSYQKSMEQLGSGNKYTEVGDDPIGVCDSAKMAVEINVNKKAIDNIALGKDLLTLAQNMQTNIMSNISRIRDLSMQAINGAYSSADKDGILKEIRARLDFIDATSDSTNFNEINIMDGSAATLLLQVGSSSSTTMDVGEGLIDTHTAALGIDLLPAFTGATWTDTDISNYLTNLETATKTLVSTNAKLGSFMDRLDFVSGTLTNMNENLTENKSMIADVDTAAASADMFRYQVLEQASVGILAQANQLPNMALTLLDNLK